MLLSPDGGITNQSSTTTVFVAYTSKDSNDVAYATTYSTAGSGSGYLYKISNVFKGVAAPTIVWSVPINAIPSSPVYDRVSNKVFFTDGKGRIDYVIDTGISPSVVYSAVLANGDTAENPVIVDSTRQMVYALSTPTGPTLLSYKPQRVWRARLQYPWVFKARSTPVRTNRRSTMRGSRDRGHR